MFEVRNAKSAGKLLGLVAVCLAGPLLMLHEIDREMPARMNDLLPRWIGVRAAILDRQNPYSEEVTRRIQTAYYGQPIPAGVQLDQQRFAYPGHAVLWFAPLAVLPFETARNLFLLLAAPVVLLSFYLWAKIGGYKAPRREALIVGGLVLTSWPVIWAFRLQQLTLMIAAAAPLACYWARDRRPVLAGIALSVLTLKPQLFLVFLAWFVLWAATRRAWQMLLAFGASCFACAVAAELLVPGWWSWWREGAKAYLEYTQAQPALTLLLGWPVGLAATAALCVAAGRRLFEARDAHPYDPAFGRAAALALAVGAAICPTTQAMAYNQVLLIPGLLVMLRDGPPGGVLPHIAHQCSLATMKVSIPLIAVAGVWAQWFHGATAVPFLFFFLPVLVAAGLLKGPHQVKKVRF